MTSERPHNSSSSNNFVQKITRFNSITGKPELQKADIPKRRQLSNLPEVVESEQETMMSNPLIESFGVQSQIPVQKSTFTSAVSERVRAKLDDTPKLSSQEAARGLAENTSGDPVSNLRTKITHLLRKIGSMKRSGLLSSDQSILIKLLIASRDASIFASLENAGSSLDDANLEVFLLNVLKNNPTNKKE
jgi:hypothetical protein